MLQLKRQTCGLAAALVLIAWSALAHADTVELACQGSGLPEMFVSVDLNRGTAAAWAIGYKHSDVADSRATITNKQVTWSTTYQSSGHTVQFTLDRMNGTMTMLSPGATDIFHCSKQAPVL